MQSVAWALPLTRAALADLVGLACDTSQLNDANVPGASIPA